MDNNAKRGGAVDDILEELRQRGGAKPAAGSRSVDDILSEMGLGGKPWTPPRPAGAPPAVPPAAGKADTPPAGRQFTAPVHTAPVPDISIPAQAAPPAGAQAFAGWPAPPAGSRTGDTPDIPADEQPRRPGRQPDAGAPPAGLPSLDALAPPAGGDDAPPRQRVGKAAALDRVDAGKFTGDAELARWFSGEEDTPQKRRADKKAEKQRRKEEARQRRQGRDDDRDDRPDSEDMAAFGAGGEETPGLWAEDAGGATQAFEAIGDTAAFAAIRDTVQAKTVRPRQPAADETDRFAAFDADAAGTSGGDTAGRAGGHTGTFAAMGEDTLAAAARAALSMENASTASFAAIGSVDLEMTQPVPVGAWAGKPPAGPAAAAPKADARAPAKESAEEGEGEERDTLSFDLDDGEPGAQKVPTAAFTQEFENGEEPPAAAAPKGLYLDDMVDDRFREFFGETVIIDREEAERGHRQPRKRKKSRSAIITGEFVKLAEMVEQAEEDEETFEEDFEDYERPQDAPLIETDIALLRATLTRRAVATGVIALLLVWLGLGAAGAAGLPAFMAPDKNPVVLACVYLALLIAAAAINFTTVTTGLIGLFGEPTVDSAPALAALGGLLQGVFFLIGTATGGGAEATLFGGAAALALALNALGKRVRAVTILQNFRLASAGYDHSAGYVLDDSQEIAYNITKGLEERSPCLLVSRPTALVKGFLRQSFSQRGSDRVGRILGWVLLGAAVVATLFTAVLTKNAYLTVSAAAGLLCIGAPLSSSLLAAVPSALMQRSASRVGAVVPGWSAIEELGQVNVVMATARDIFPPSAVTLRGIKTFEKERIDLAILYAASVLIEGCDTLRDIFLGVIQGKSDMLYKVESLLREPGYGFTAWVDNNRVVIGSREMLQKHGIDPPPIEIELKHVPDGHMPVYLAVSGRLFAMFVVGYSADPEVADTIDSLVQSGVSLLVSSDDMNVTGELIERAYDLPHGVVKVLGRRETELLQPLTAYLPESEGVMTHMGTFASFIGGMRAAAACAAAEGMSGIVQIVAVALACLLALMLVFGSGLAGLGLPLVLLYQISWGLLVSALPFLRRY